MPKSSYTLDQYRRKLFAKQKIRRPAEKQGPSEPLYDAFALAAAIPRHRFELDLSQREADVVETIKKQFETEQIAIQGICAHPTIALERGYDLTTPRLLSRADFRSLRFPNQTDEGQSDTLGDIDANDEPRQEHQKGTWRAKWREIRILIPRGYSRLYARTGKKGRPSGKPLIYEELRRRIAKGYYRDSKILKYDLAREMIAYYEHLPASADGSQRPKLTISSLNTDRDFSRLWRSINTKK